MRRVENTDRESGPPRWRRGAARRVLVVVGTRPEAVKLAPVVRELERVDGWQPVVVTSGQHGTVVDEVLDTFGTPADVPLAPWSRDGDLAGLAAELLTRLADTVRTTEPDAVVVQGDTSTTWAGAVAGFWAGVPVVHVEAGLRSGDLTAPFPEEGNRRMIAPITALHLAPTAGAADALLTEGVDPATVLVTGNTVVDAVRWLAAARSPERTPEREGTSSPRLRHDGRRQVLVTCHRRENWGEGTRRIAAALRSLTCDDPRLDVTVAAHPNPAVRAVLDAELGDLDAVTILDAVPYGRFVSLLDRSHLVLTDSGGVQEEAAALGVPALVLREVTERREGVDAGLAELVGTDPHRIVGATRRELERVRTDRRDDVPCPYGDGRAARRTVDAIRSLLDGTAMPAPFRAPSGRVTAPSPGPVAAVRVGRRPVEPLVSAQPRV